ncbi:olfactory receptor 1019-like isoform X2 [Sphaerodactylus townsendi]|uniref:olfactory receptor 1019-like isoform X2 n=1 Tax=Sphaerodactylus townsendi TaxID=933632 RepID=UPI00202741B1|nr:olfactory receptor 1019-like isoform X2 [Sphaerodactylus townsendi]
MNEGNYSSVNEFILLGLTDNPKMQLPLFALFLLVYIIIVIGNVGMILLICTVPQLHNPMYFFLGNLSVVDLCYSTVTAPKMLADFLADSKRISYNACALQLYLFAFFADVECALLAVMAYDRYVAICNPLLYTVIMSNKVCKRLMAVAYIIGTVDSIAYTCSIFQLSFCSSNIINHFFCDMPPLFELSCSDTYISEIVVFIFDGYVEAGSLGIILVSYIYILTTIMRMRSAEGRQKAFSTCTSHLTIVRMFHGTALFMYLQPSSSHSMEEDKWISLFYAVIIPMLNPLIYSLRNKDVKHALTRALRKIGHSH